MKKAFLVLLTLLVYEGGGRLIAQKYQPKYLREDNKEFKNLTEKATDNGWIRLNFLLVVIKYI